MNRNNNLSWVSNRLFSIGLGITLLGAFMSFQSFPRLPHYGSSKLRAWQEIFGSNREVELTWQNVVAETTLVGERDRKSQRAIARIRDNLELKEGKLHGKLVEVARMYKAENEARLAYKIRRAFRTMFRKSFKYQSETSRVHGIE
jgi:uncharacterized protein YabN with tetrapyrrole methylase and pyrophosphatase domain